MSCFKLPVSLCKEIEMQIRKFWWGDMVVKEKSIGRIGKFYANWNQREEWGSKIWWDLTRLCLLNKCGSYKQSKLHYRIKYSTKNISPQVQCLKQKVSRDHSLGKASLKQGMLSRKGCYREWVMGLRFGCSMTIGFLGVFQQRSYHTHKTLKMT